MSKPLNARNLKVVESKAKNFIAPGKRLSFLVSAEDVQELAAVLEGAVKNDSAVGVDLHIGKREARTGNQFMTGFFFAKDISQQDGYKPRSANTYQRRTQATEATQNLAAKTLKEDDLAF